MFRYIAVLLMFVQVTSSTAVLKADQSSLTKPGNVNITPDVVYGHKFGLALTFDVYHPLTPNGAAVIFIVSGGWRSHYESWLQFKPSASGEFTLLTEEEMIEQNSLIPQFSFNALLAKGFTVFAVRHGSSPKFDMSEIVADVRRAVRFIRYHAQHYGLDETRIGIWGVSAGGHLALLLGATGDDGDPNAEEPIMHISSRLAAVVAYFPPSDLQRLYHSMDPDDRQHFPAMSLQPEEYKIYSPIFYATTDDPATLIVHGDQDDLVPILEGTSMHEALLQAKVESKFVTIPGAGHGFEGKDAEHALEQAVEWFHQHLVGNK